MRPENRFFIDGMDFWGIFSVVVEGGSSDFLNYPAKKDSITRDWSDANGLEVDLSQVFTTEREISLQCGIIADDEAAFWEKYNAFIGQWIKPGLHRIQVAEFGLRSFYCHYKSCSNFTRVTRIQGTEKVGCKFTLNLVETEPKLDNSDVFIVDEDGRFLIT